MSEAAGSKSADEDASAATAEGRDGEPAVAPATVAAGVSGTDANVKAADPAPGAATYRTACADCHDTGREGAPRRGDEAAWSWRRPYGMEMLTRHAREGWGAMPPRGGHPELSDGEVDAATRYLLGSDS